MGLSAPQIGHSLCIIAYEFKDPQMIKQKRLSPTPLTFIINPILQMTDRQKDSQSWVPEYESCESVPHYNALVKRASSVKVSGWDLNGNDVDIKADGFLARVLQHEMDHLQGTLYIDKMVHQTLRHDRVCYTENSHF